MVAGPLDGVRVLDLTRMVAGNQLTMLLGDFGADVVKVEQPGVGDTLRHWVVQGQEVFFDVYGRNKRSVTVDLKHPGARDLMVELASHSDVVVESFRPGGLEKIGLEPEALTAANPSLVIVRISGWGQTGSMSTQPGFGTLIEAMSGFADMNGFADREPVLPPGALADMVAGTYGAFAVTMALRHAAAHGQGQVIDLSLFEPLFSLLGPQAATYALTKTPVPRTGSRSTSSAPRNVYRTADGEYVALSGSTQAMTERLFRTIGRPELIDDPRFADNVSRLKNVEALDEVIGGYFASRAREELLAEMRAAGVTVGPVMDIGQLLESDYFATREVVVPGPGRDGEVLMHQPVPRMSRTPGRLCRRAPELGEHTAEVCAALLGTEEFNALRDRGVFG